MKRAWSKQTWIKTLKISALPALVLSAVMAFTTPASAEMRGGGHSGFAGGGGHATAGRSFSSGGRDFGHGGGVVERGRDFNRGQDFDRGRYYGGGYRGGYWGGPAVGFGFGVGAYGPGCGYYDRWGRWIATGCAVPYGYGY